MISSLILVIVGLGVLESIDRSSHLDGEQKTQAVAGNVGQSEQGLVRALPLAEQSNMRSKITHVVVGGVTYTTDSRSEWINDASGGASCTTPDSTADYMKISTTVTWPQMGTRKPVKLESLVTPSVRSFDATQGTLSVQVSDRNGNGVGGLPVDLTGGATLSDATSSDGCVLWGYLPAGSGYAVGFSRPGYVQPDGSPAVSAPVAVVGGQTSNVAFQYDAGGRLETSFVTKRNRGDATMMPTSPGFAHITKGAVFINVPFTGDRLTSGLLFPFTTPYSVDADSCASSDWNRGTALPSSPWGPVPARIAPTVAAGMTTTSAPVQLPAMNVRVTTDGAPDVGPPTAVRVTTGCSGTVYHRTTIAGGWIDDPGFPIGSAFQICVSDGTHSHVITRDNLNFNAANFTIDIKAATDPVGTCA